MKRRILIISCILLTAVLLGGLLGWKHYQDTHYIYINDIRYSRSVTHLNLRSQKDPQLDAVCQLEYLEQLDLRNTGIDIEDYNRLRAALPTCQILWDIPFQGRFLDMNTTKLTVSALSAEDLDALSFFSKLKEVDALECADYELLHQLQTRYPDLSVFWQITIGSEQFPANTAALTAENPDTAQLELALKWLPDLQSIHLTGTLPDIAWLTDTAAKYPHVKLTWEYEVCGRLFASDAEEIDLSDIPLENADEVEAALTYFPSLTKVVMCNCGISNEDMDALNRRYENIKFVWLIYIGKHPVRTDTIALMPWQFCSGVFDHDLKDLKYLTDLICLDLGHQKVKDLSFLYYMPNMQYLMLADTPVSDATPIGSCKELKYLELFFTGIMDVSPLANCTKLEDINLSWMTILNLQTLMELPNVQRFWLNNTDAPEEVVYALMRAMPNTTFSYVELGDSVGFGWHQSPNYYAQRDLLGMWYMD